MMRWLLVAVTLLWPLQLSAGVLAVRSGDHPGFSRLVVDAEGPVDWRFGRSGSDYVLQLAGEDVQLDIAGIFGPMSRQRVAAVTVDGGRLILTVREGVRADAFEIGQTRIVIDIHDGPPDPAAPSEQVLSLPVEAGALDLVRAPPASVPPRPRPERPVGLPVVTAVPPQSPVRPLAPVPFAPITPSPMALPSERVSALEQELLEQLGRAASQGLLEVVPGLTEDDAPETPEVAAGAPEVVLTDVPPEVTALSHMNVRTRADIDAPEDPRPRVDSAGHRCLAPGVTDVASWVIPGAEISGLAALRMTLLGEFDTPVPEAVRDLARHYLYLGFGAEASAVLGGFGLVVEDTDVLLAMADILDLGGTSRPGRLGGQAACATPAVLWSVLASEAANPALEFDRDILVTTFSELPGHLRLHLGPMLSERLIEMGQAEVARSVRNAMARTAVPEDPALGMIDARLALAEGDTDGALATLDGLRHADGPAGPEAVLALINTSLAQGLAVDPLRIRDAEAFAFERRGTVLGAALTEAAIRATLANGAASDALTMLQVADRAGAVTPDALMALSSATFDALAHAGDDLAFLRAAVGPSAQRLLDHIDDPARRSVAARLLSLGFPGDAHRVMAGLAGTPGRGDRLLFARIALAQGRERIALGYLAGLDGPNVAGVRAEVNAAEARHADAARDHALAGQADLASHEAFLSGDWALVSEIGTDRHRAIAAELGGAAQTSDAAGSLQAGLAAVERSAELRGLLGGLIR